MLGGVSSTGSDISANDDLNNYTSFGYYVCGQSATAATLSNKPDALAGAFKLEVKAGITNAANRIIQTIYTTGGEIYTRTRYTTGWTPWSRMDGYGCTTLQALATALKPYLD